MQMEKTISYEGTFNFDVGIKFLENNILKNLETKFLRTWKFKKSENRILKFGE